MKIVFMGTPKFGVKTLEALNQKYEVLLVVSQPDTYRKGKPVYSKVKEKAIELGIEVFQPLNIKTDYTKILDVNADILITAAYGQIVPKLLLDSFKKCINIHGSILPKYRGGAPIQRSIIDGEEYSGVTIMEMVKKMDSGKIYAQEKVKILDIDNNETIFEKLSIVGCRLLMDNIISIINEENLGIPQDEALVTYAPNLSKEEEKIDFTKTSKEVFNQIRGLAMEPGAYFEINGNIIKVYSSIIVDDNSEALAGEIISLNKEIVIKTKDKAISLIEIKPAGKNVMKAKDFLNGQRLIKIGDRLI